MLNISLSAQYIEYIYMSSKCNLAEEMTTMLVSSYSLLGNNGLMLCFVNPVCFTMSMEIIGVNVKIIGVVVLTRK